MNRIRTAVIGLGWMGSHYARIASQAHNADLVAVCDHTKQTTDTFSKELQAIGYTDAGTMFKENEDLDAVIIATPESLHLEPVKMAVEAGVNILLEKPVATLIPEARQIVEICERAGVTLGICHHMRYDPRYASVRNAIVAGEIGDIVHLFARRNLPTWSPQHLSGRIEVTMWTGVHDIDMMNWVVQKPVVRVTTKGRKDFLKEFDVHDVIVSIFEFSDGTIAVLENSWATPAIQGRPRSFVFEVRGTKGVAEVAGYETGGQVFTETSARPLDTYYRFDLNGTWIGPYRDLVVDYFDALLQGRPPLITGRDGLASTVIADAVLRSLKSGNSEEVEWDE